MPASKQKTAQWKIKGPCTIYEAEAIQEKLTVLLNKAESVNLDITNVEDLDASFIQLLVASHKQAKIKNVKLNVVGNAEIFTKFVEGAYCPEAMSGDFEITYSDDV